MQVRSPTDGVLNWGKQNIILNSSSIILNTVKCHNYYEKINRFGISIVPGTEYFFKGIPFHVFGTSYDSWCGLSFQTTLFIYYNLQWIIFEIVGKYYWIRIFQKYSCCGSSVLVKLITSNLVHITWLCISNNNNKNRKRGITNMVNKWI